MRIRKHYSWFVRNSRGGNGAGAGPATEEGRLLGVAREPRRSFELGACLGQTAGAEQDVAARRRQWCVVAERRFTGELVEQLQAGLGPVGHAVGDGAIERHDGRRHDEAEPIVEPGNAGPVGFGG